MVLRFNRAKIKGHEEDVGQFWTHWCCTFRDKSYHGIKRYPIQNYYCCDSIYHVEEKHNFKIVSGDIIKYMPGRWLEELCEKYATSFYTPSTGLRLLWWIYKYTGTKINRARLFGFDCFCELGKTPREAGATVMARKYYCGTKPSPKHRPAMERAIYNEITS